MDSPESSGLAAADDVLYTMNDSSGTTELYVFDADGNSIGTQTIDGAENVDWEDLAVGVCPAAVDAASCLYIADIGDNDETRDSVALYVVPASIEARETAVKCPLRYEDGEAHDAEALLVFADGSVRIADKQSDGESRIWRVDALDCGSSPQTMTKEAKLELDAPVTGGAVRADGGEIVLRTKTSAWAWWGCTVDWDTSPTEVAIGDEAQGEAVAFTPSGGLYTSSEGKPLSVGVVPCDTFETLDCPDPEDGCGCGASGASPVPAALLAAIAVARRRQRR